MSSIVRTLVAVSDPAWMSLLWMERAIRAVLVFGVFIAASYAIGMPDDATGRIVSNLVFSIVSAGAAVFCFRAARRLVDAGRPWRFFGFGCLSWFAGQLVWNWYDVIRWQTVPYPSLADLGYTAFYPFMFIGLILLVRERIGRLPAIEVIIDSLIVETAFALIAHEVVLMPLTGGGSLTTSELVVTLAWQVSAISLVLLAGVALFVCRDNLTRGPLSFLLVGFVAFAIADVIYGAFALRGSYSAGSLLDLGWQQGFLFIAVAALIATRSSSSATPIDHAGERRSSAVRVALIVASVLIVTAMAAYAASQPRVDRTIVVLVSLTGVLLAVRLGYAALQAERLIRRTSERDRLAGVVAASRAVSATLDLETLLPILASAAAEAVGRKKGEVYVFTEDLAEVELSAQAGFTATETALFQSLIDAPIGAFPAEARVIETHEPSTQWIDELGIPAAEVVAFRQTGKLYTLVTPLIAHGHVLGVFDMWTPHDTTPFDAGDVAAAAAIGQQAGLAIHNARLLARMQRQAAEKESLLRVSQAAVSSLELDDVLSLIAEASLGIASAEACSIEIWKPEHDQTILAAEATIPDWPGTAPIGTPIPLADWPSTRRAIEEQQTLNLLTTDPSLTNDERAHYQADGTERVLVVPLLIDGRCLGVLDLFSRSSRPFSADETRLARELAAQIAVAIDRARLHEAIRERADTDGLTGLLNHRAILETLDHEIARTRRVAGPLAVMMIDLDGFKQINDVHGHQVGDQVLRETAGVLRNGIREVDYAGRYGGDEFLLILPETNIEEARHLACRILDLAESTLIVSAGRHLPIQISIGIATLPDDGVTRQALISVSDTRMYESKSARRWITAAG